MATEFLDKFGSSSKNMLKWANPSPFVYYRSCLKLITDLVSKLKRGVIDVVFIRDSNPGHWVVGVDTSGGLMWSHIFKNFTAPSSKLNIFTQFIKN